MGRPRARIPHRLLTIVFFFVLDVPLSLFGQPTPKEKIARTPLARFAPVSAGVFVSCRDSTELEKAIRQANAWGIVPLLLGNTETGAPLGDLRTVLGAFLGADRTAALGGVIRTEVGLAGRSWADLGDGVLLVRLPSPTALSEWLPEDQRQDVQTAGKETLFRMRDGMMVGVREGIAGFARRKGDGEVLRDTFKLIHRGEGESLQDSAEYRELASYLPARPLALVYLTRNSAENGAPSDWLGWSDFQQAFIGLYGREGRLDVAIRARTSNAQPRRPLAASALERFLRLPATTLFGSLSAMDFHAEYDKAMRGSPDGAVVRSLNLFEALRAATGRSLDSFPSIGPHWIAAWDGGLESEGGGPPLALLVESSEAPELAEELERTADSLFPADSTGGNEDGADVAPTVTYTTHLGTRLRHVPLGAFVADDSSPLGHLLAELELSWTAQDGWLIVSLSRENLRRLVDAELNLVPTLSNLPDAQALRRGGNSSSLVIAQPDLAADVLQSWMGRANGPSGTWFGDRWWSEALATEGLPSNRMGIGMRIEQMPGAVVVARIHPNTPAQGRLLPEDWIVGIDGQLLDLDSPNTDLRRRWAAPGSGAAHLLRVIRQGVLLDVALPVQNEGVGWSNLLMRPIDAVRELAIVGKTMRFASWTVHTADPMHYSALVSLRFGPAASK